MTKEFFLAINVYAWSHLNLRGTALFEMYRCMNLITISAVVFVTTFAVGNLDHLSIATKIYASLFSSSGRGPAKSKCTPSLGSTNGSIWNFFFPYDGF